MQKLSGRKFMFVNAFSAGIVAIAALLLFASSPNPLFAKETAKVSKTGNRLRYEKSPYLLQHKDNPVDWYPWGDEAFEKAKRENKPIFLSIGYSTCHWCHVMEHESFEDEEVAKLMNNTFVSIKVDREERPDIDQIYMTVSQMLTGKGGWPLTIVMTPDKKPFFAATYIPRETRYGRMGMLEFVPHIKKIWAEKRDELLESADKVTAALQQASSASPTKGALNAATLKTAFGQLAKRFDPERGGFGAAPKFPSPHNLLFLLRHWKRTGDATALEMVERTLYSMSMGGIYDHIGFGFHRYSTDAQWFLPHFEKMLYDQAMLTMAYTELYLATGNKDYKRVSEEILTYVLRDMTSKEGGFYSAEDADSEGVEGKFYLWSEPALIEALGEKEAKLTALVFNATEHGNYREEATGERLGSNILHLRKPLSLIASELKLSEAELRRRLEVNRQKLFEIREKRIHPYKDDKILTDWNGLMISALAKAYQAFDEPKYLEAAKRSADFILAKLVDPDGDEAGGLLHRYRDGEAAIMAKVDDYSFLIMALIDLYEASFEINYLKKAIALNDDFIAHFWDGENGGFYFTSDIGEKLLVRPKEIYDGAVPSGNSIAMLNLIRLDRITTNSDMGKKAEAIGQAFFESVNRYPAAYGQLMVGLDFGVGPSYEVVIVGDPQAKDTQKMLRALRAEFVPNKVVLLKPTNEEKPEIIKIAVFIKGQKALGGKATAYVCKNYECKLPTTDISKMLEFLNAPK